MLRERTLRIPIVIGAVVVALAAGCSSTAAHRAVVSSRPNIVFILTDDLDLTSYADAARFPEFHDLLTTAGTTFTNYYVTDSLCCPSCASMLRGQYVHDHGVESNLPPTGGFARWQQLGRDSSTVATWLHDAGYHTGLVGKYLNGYPDTVAHNYIPPGWDDFASPVAGNAYAEYNYSLNENGKVHHYGADPQDYLVDVLAEKSRDFIDQNAGAKPFFLYVAPYVPHQPATPAPRYQDAFPDVTAPRTESFDRKNGPAEPKWLQQLPPLQPIQIRYIDRLYRRRLQSMLGVEDLLRGVVDALRSANQLDNTYIVFASDNGFHLGQHRLPPGKQTAYDEDIHVPLVVRGPGVAAGANTPAFARAIDLAPTFAAIADATPPPFVDGTSLLPVLNRDPNAKGLPHDVLIEHYSSANTKAGPLAAAKEPDNDANPPSAGAPASGAAAPIAVPKSNEPFIIPTYKALRTKRYLYVQYDTRRRQLFDLQNDPAELHNIVTTANPDLVRRLAARLAYLGRCSGTTCRT